MFIKCKFIYPDSKSAVDERLGVEDRTGCKGTQGKFHVDECLYLDCCSGFTGGHMDENTSNFILTMGVAYCT